MQHLLRFLTVLILDVLQMSLLDFSVANRGSGEDIDNISFAKIPTVNLKTETCCP